MQKSIRGICPNCRGGIEVPASHVHPLVICPGCGREASVRAVVASRRGSVLAQWAVWAGVFIVLAIGLGVLGYVYRGHLLSGLDLVAEATGNRTMAVLTLGFGLLALGCLFLWMLFPLIVYVGLKDLRRRTRELDQTAKLCLRHLARLPAAGMERPETTIRKADVTDLRSNAREQKAKVGEEMGEQSAANMGR